MHIPYIVEKYDGSEKIFDLYSKLLLVCIILSIVSSEESVYSVLSILFLVAILDSQTKTESCLLISLSIAEEVS